MQRRGRVRKRYVALILFLLFVAWAGWKVVSAVTAKRGPLVDYGQQLLDMSGNMQPDGENGWPIMVQALQKFTEIGLPALPDWPMDPSASENIRGLVHVSEGEYDAARLKFELAYLDYIRESGVLEQLDDFAAHPRCVREAWQTDGDGGLLFVLLPELAQSRLLAKARVASMRIAAQSGDTAELVRAWRHAISLGRAMSFDATLISHLVGIAINSMACEELNRILTESELDEATCRQLLSVLDERPVLAPITAVLERERIAQYDLIQRTFSDNGHGDGILLFDQFQQLTDFTGSNPSGISSNHQIYNVAGLVVPRRAETMRTLDEYFDLAVQQAKMSRVMRDRQSVHLDQFVETLPRFQFLLRITLPAIGSLVNRNDMAQCQIDATRLLLAIEMYQAKHGQLPATLEELSPEFLPEIPQDPVACRPYVYVLREPSEADPRTFWLYSIGSDRVDNGGTEGPDHKTAALTGGFGARNFDYVFNRLREPYSDKSVEAEVTQDGDSSEMSLPAEVPQPTESDGG